MSGKQAIADALTAVERDKVRYLPDPVYLGDGNGNLAVIGQEQNRIAYYYEEAPNGVRSIGTAPLWSLGGIPYVYQLPTQQPIQVFLGYPAHEDRVYIINQTPVGLQATGGTTISEQVANQANFPTVQNLTEFRVGISPVPGLNEVYVNQGTYTIPSTGARTEWGGATTTVIQTAITALNGTGKEQIGWITFDDETGTVHLETNTASTPPGVIPNRADFSDSAIMGISTTYKKNIPIYLYDGQTLTEADIYRRLDSRLAWFPSPPDAGTLSVNDGATTVANITSLTFNGGTITGSTPNATYTPPGGGGGGDYILIREEETQGTDGGTFTSGSWATRVLNTLVSNVGGWASISGNQVTLAAGTYRINASAPAVQCARNQTRWQNITDSTTTIIGTSEYAGGTGTTDSGCRSFVEGRFTIAGSKTFELQHQCQTTKTGVGLGVAGNFTTEVYSIVTLIRE